MIRIEEPNSRGVSVQPTTQPTDGNSHTQQGRLQNGSTSEPMEPWPTRMARRKKPTLALRDR
jgi:hypothetical protein